MEMALDVEWLWHRMVGGGARLSCLALYYGIGVPPNSHMNHLILYLIYNLHPYDLRLTNYYHTAMCTGW